MKRYQVDWCVDSHEDNHSQYFAEFERAAPFALDLVSKGKTFHGACGITEQKSEEHIEHDKNGLMSDYWTTWDDVKKWECDGKKIYLI